MDMMISLGKLKTINRFSNFLVCSNNNSHCLSLRFSSMYIFMNPNSICFKNEDGFFCINKVDYIEVIELCNDKLIFETVCNTEYPAKYKVIAN